MSKPVKPPPQSRCRTVPSPPKFPYTPFTTCFFPPRSAPGNFSLVGVSTGVNFLEANAIRTFYGHLSPSASPAAPPGTLKHASAPGPLHVPSPSPGRLFLQVAASSLPPGPYSNHTLREAFPIPCYMVHTPSPLRFALFPGVPRFTHLLE